MFKDRDNARTLVRSNRREFSENVFEEKSNIQSNGRQTPPTYTCRGYLILTKYSGHNIVPLFF